MTASTLQLDIDGKSRQVKMTAGDRDGLWHAVLDGVAIEIDAHLLQPGVLSLIVQRGAHRCVLDQGPVETAIQIGGNRFVFSMDDPRSLTARRKKSSGAAGGQTIKAPMPGRIVRLLVAAGDLVEAHQGVVVIEAMKMQNELKATRPGRVNAVQTEAGQTVKAGQTLLLIE